MPVTIESKKHSGDGVSNGSVDRAGIQAYSGKTKLFKAENESLIYRARTKSAEKYENKAKAHESTGDFGNAATYYIKAAEKREKAVFKNRPPHFIDSSEMPGNFLEAYIDQKFGYEKGDRAQFAHIADDNIKAMNLFDKIGDKKGAAICSAKGLLYTVLSRSDSKDIGKMLDIAKTYFRQGSGRLLLDDEQKKMVLDVITYSQAKIDKRLLTR